MALGLALALYTVKETRRDVTQLPAGRQNEGNRIITSLSPNWIEGLQRCSAYPNPVIGMDYPILFSQKELELDRRHSSKDLRWTRDSFLFSLSDAYRDNIERRFYPSAVSPPKAIRDGRNLVEAPKWEPIERELLVVLLAINIFLRTADVKNLCEFLIFFDGLSEKKSISTLKTFWKVAYGKSIPNQYEPVRDLPFPWKKVSLRIDSLPTERKMLASIPSPFFL
ncbi:hypothetical protein RIF29_47824 [Crotalaria pallida]|uniref:Uncharacterized protein n=1 Tax=Crotalaria pallida TaxID=3830 RepID=A0AAN9HJD6_CROPI